MPYLKFQFGTHKYRTIKMDKIALALELVRTLGSDKDISQFLGISRNVLHRWRNGIKPHPYNLEKLANLLQIPLDWLLD